MIPCDILHHITKYEWFLSNGVLVMEFTSCYISQHFTVSKKMFNTGGLWLYAYQQQTRKGTFRLQPFERYVTI